MDAPGQSGGWRVTLPLWSAFAGAHAWLAFLNLGPFATNFSDVSVLYRFWAERAVSGGPVVGIDEPFVYPVLALAPILASIVAGAEAYGATWLVVVTALNAAAFALLVGSGSSPRAVRAGWWWVLFLVLLGPIALGRLDAVSVPIALAGAGWLATRPALAAVLFTIGAWIKVWPGALVAALLVASPARLRVVIAAASTTLVILLLAVVAGTDSEILGFVTAQTDRGLQIESPVATAWLWLAATGGGATLYFDPAILTFQVAGPGTDAVAAIMTPLLVIAVAVLCALGAAASRRGVAPAELIPPLSLALVTALIVFNKVGSPQFIAWLAVPVILGLIVGSPGFRVVAGAVATTALLTQLIYPLFYDSLLALEPGMLLLLTARNALLLALFGWAVVRHTQLIRGTVDVTAPRSQSHAKE